MVKSVSHISVFISIALALAPVSLYAANSLAQLQDYGLSLLVDPQTHDFEINDRYIEIEDFIDHSEDSNCKQLSSAEISTALSQKLAAISRPELDQQKVNGMVLDIFPANQYRVCTFKFLSNTESHGVVRNFILVHTGEEAGVLFEFWQNFL